MRVGSLFSGIGLLDLGLENVGYETVWQCEHDKQASKVLAEHWPTVPNFGDITKVDWSKVESVDVIAGGFPCQPFSSAGLMKGASDERYLWPEFHRAIRCLRPRLVIVENVAALIRAPEWGTILGDLAEAGYDARWRVLRASDVGAPHRRERVFVVAYASSARPRLQGSASGQERTASDALQPKTVRSSDGEDGTEGASTGSLSTTDTERQGLQGFSKRAVEWPSESAEINWGPYQPAIRRWGRLTRPVPSPTDERRRLSVRFVEWMMGAPQGWTDCASRTGALRGLGNGVVVQVAEEIGRWAMEVVE